MLVDIKPDEDAEDQILARKYRVQRSKPVVATSDRVGWAGPRADRYVALTVSTSSSPA